ncbi:MAG: hypothetical protein ABI472_04380 [Ginsengibacter sp.]
MCFYKKTAYNEYNGILDYKGESIVSLEIKANRHSCSVDGTLTSVTRNYCKMAAWFYNECGFTSHVIDWLSIPGKMKHEVTNKQKIEIITTEVKTRLNIC